MKTILALAVITAAIVTTAGAEKISIALKSGGSMTGTLVGKSATEIKVETDFGIIPPPGRCGPVGNYVVQNPSTKKPQPGKRIEKREAGLSVDDIERAYASNPVAADLRFKNKPIAVTGVINNIGTSEWGRPFVRIGDRVIKHYPWGSEKKNPSESRTNDHPHRNLLRSHPS